MASEKTDTMVDHVRAELGDRPGMGSELSWWQQPLLRRLYLMMPFLFLGSTTLRYDGSLLNGLQTMDSWQSCAYYLFVSTRQSTTNISFRFWPSSWINTRHLWCYAWFWWPCRPSICSLYYRLFWQKKRDRNWLPFYPYGCNSLGVPAYLQSRPHVLGRSIFHWFWIQHKQCNLSIAYYRNFSSKAPGKADDSV